LRDALDLVSKRAPKLIDKFGGHAMAAGLSLREENFAEFAEAFEAVGREWLSSAALEQIIETDGSLESAYFSLDFIALLETQVWGQGFAPPVFCEEVEIVSQRLVGEKHLSLKMKHQGQPVDGIWFGRTEPLPSRVKLAYRLDADEWQGQKRVRFLVEGAEV
jgi:single-stranded-DNA-specific exonuclease